MDGPGHCWSPVIWRRARPPTIFDRRQQLLHVVKPWKQVFYENLLFVNKVSIIFVPDGMSETNKLINIW